jgi:hypothetical protein
MGAEQARCDKFSTSVPYPKRSSDRAAGIRRRHRHGQRGCQALHGGEQRAVGRAGLIVLALGSCRRTTASVRRDSGGVLSKPLRKAEPVAPLASFVGKDYAAAIPRVALIGSFSTLQSALKFISRGLT